MQSVNDFLRYWATIRPNRDVAVCGDRRLGWGGLLRDSGAVAATLQGMGVSKGDRVGLMLDNSLEWVVAYLGILQAGAVLVPLGLVGALWYASPPLYDLSTDFDTPPEFPPAMPARLPWMNPLTPAVSGDALTQLTAYPDVLGRRYDAAPDRVAEGVATVLKSFGWPVTARDAPSPDEIRFTATAHSFVLGLKSDMVIRLLDEGETTYVDIRSLSRYGKRDMGLNAAFISAFLGALEGEVNKAPADVE